MSFKNSQNNNPRRQKLVRETGMEEAPSYEPSIANLAELKQCLQQALFVEHFTIPPYLCALYSMHDACNMDAARIIRSVAVEEMLHMVMVANIMNAIGGQPRINGKDMAPQYPGPLPYSSGKYQVSLLKFSREAVNTFLRIERPAVENAPPTDKFNSIGEFYSAVRTALIRFERQAQSQSGTIFTGDARLQVTSEHYYGSGGKLVAVYSIKDALDAIDEIVGQGEGIDGSISVTKDLDFDDDVEYAHYFRFNEIFHERRYRAGDTAQRPPSGTPMPVDWNAVHNMEPNPMMDRYSDNPFLQEKMRDFNRTYMKLLDNIHTACNGAPEALLQGIPLMLQLKHQAVELMKIPNGNGNYTAGPSFEYIPL